MADQQRDSSSGGTNSPQDNTTDNDKVQHSNGDLANFIQEQHERQMEQGDGQEVDADRTANFFNRALSESQRMNAEVAKSQQRRSDLHAELGANNFAAWTQEHADQSLEPGAESNCGSQS